MTVGPKKSQGLGSTVPRGRDDLDCGTRIIRGKRVVKVEVEFGVGKGKLRLGLEGSEGS